ncbi:MAG: hypothetical protein MUO72_14525 [Bacteroidales bacterium]|nr:hypothetical protein [Bacteroidales bacterium]
MNSINLVTQAGIGENKTIRGNIIGFNVFSNSNIILTPDKLNEKNMFELFNIYQIDCVLYGEVLYILRNDVSQDISLIGLYENGSNISLYEGIKK